jgi:hypothetical protein
MKKLIFVIILFQFKLVIGQNIVKFDSIVFYYNYSTYASKKNKSETETIKINRVDNSYYISNKKVDYSLINNLSIELNTNRDNFSNNYFLSKKLNVKKCKIKKHITFYSQILKSKNKKVTQKLKTQLIADIKNLKEFVEFIEFEKPKKEAIYGSTDSRKNISISFFQNSKKSYFEFETFHSCGQPFYSGEKLIKNKIVNLDVNQLIIDILPNESKLRKEFNYNNILDKYISWYVLKEFEKI